MRRLAALCLVALGATSSPVAAQLAPGASKADAERAIQAYLALWSRDASVNAGSVMRFYAPRVVYYGKAMTRAQVLADKRAYIRAWPERRYAEVPGSLKASCAPDGRSCTVTAIMSWRRVSGAGRVSTGRARLSFDFVPADGARKIAREGARTL